MTQRGRSSNTRRRGVLAVVVLVLSSTTIGYALIHKRLRQLASLTPTAHEQHLQPKNRAAMRSFADMPEAQVPISQFEVSRSVVAGGGGTSTNGNLQLNGTVGQGAAGAVSSGGQYSVAGGFWATESTTGATPTPTPTP